MKTKHIKIRRRGEEKTWTFELVNEGGFWVSTAKGMAIPIWVGYKQQPWDFELIEMWEGDNVEGKGAVPGESCLYELNHQTIIELKKLILELKGELHKIQNWIDDQSKNNDTGARFLLCRAFELIYILRQKLDKEEEKEFFSESVADKLDKSKAGPLFKEQQPKENYQPFKNGCILCGKTTGCTHSNDETIEFLKHKPKESAREKLDLLDWPGDPYAPAWLRQMHRAFISADEDWTVVNVPSWALEGEKIAVKNHVQFIWACVVPSNIDLFVLNEIAGRLRALLAREAKLDEARKSLQKIINSMPLWFHAPTSNMISQQLQKLKELFDE